MPVFNAICSAIAVKLVRVMEAIKYCLIKRDLQRNSCKAGKSDASYEVLENISLRERLGRIIFPRRLQLVYYRHGAARGSMQALD